MKKFLIVVCVLAIVFGLSLYGVGKSDDQVAKKAKKAYEKGGEYLKQKNLAKAEEAFQQVVQMEPEWGMGYAGMASLKVQQNRFEEALPYFAKALDLSPQAKNTALEYAQILNRLGMSAMGSRQLEKSNDYLLKIMDIPSLETYNKRLFLNNIYLVANNFSGLNQFEKAVAYISKLIKSCAGQPDLADLYANGNYLAGICLSRLKKYDEANPHLQKYIELNKDNPGALQYVAIANYMLGINHYDVLNQKVEAIKAEPMSAENKAKVDALNVKRDKVINSRQPNRGEKITKIDNDIVVVKNADSLEKRERIAKLALETQVIEPFLAAAIQGMPTLEDAYVRVGNYYYLCKNLDKAIAAYKLLIEKFPTSVDINAYKAFLQVLEKESAEAKKAAETKK